MYYPDRGCIRTFHTLCDYATVIRRNLQGLCGMDLMFLLQYVLLIVLWRFCPPVLPSVCRTLQILLTYAKEVVFSTWLVHLFLS